MFHSTHMVELKHSWIGLSAVNARVALEVRGYEFPVSCAVTRIVNAVIGGVLPGVFAVVAARIAPITILAG